MSHALVLTLEKSHPNLMLIIANAA